MLGRGATTGPWLKRALSDVDFFSASSWHTSLSVGTKRISERSSAAVALTPCVCALVVDAMFWRFFSLLCCFVFRFDYIYLPLTLPVRARVFAFSVSVYFDRLCDKPFNQPVSVLQCNCVYFVDFVFKFSTNRCKVNTKVYKCDKPVLDSNCCILVQRGPTTKVS